MIKSLISAVACIAIATMFAANASAQTHLFSQYSTSGANNVNASLYPAPHPVPGYVGSSAFTYQPLLPHEMMYTHSRNYFNVTGGPEQHYRDPYGARAYPGGSHLNVTKVRWQSGSMGYGNLPFSGYFGNLKYKAATRRYSVPPTPALGGFGSLGGSGLGIGGGGLGGGLRSRCSLGNCSGGIVSGGLASGEVIDGGHGYSDPAPVYAEPVYTEPFIPSGSHCASGTCAKLTDSTTVNK